MINGQEIYLKVNLDDGESKWKENMGDQGSSSMYG